MTNVCPQWPAPSNISALTTTRTPGVSLGNYASNNLGLHVGDVHEHASANREALIADLPSVPHWLEQTHSTDCIIIEDDKHRNADAAITRQKNTVLAIMTADCQPIILCNQQGTEIAAIHAGWRGLLNGVIENTIAKMRSAPEEIIAWIGPSICQACFDVGGEVRDLFSDQYHFSTPFFKQKGLKWLGNMPAITEKILNELAIFNITKSQYCTFENENEFYSYRREQQTGRMATLIWIN